MATNPYSAGDTFGQPSTNTTNPNNTGGLFGMPAQPDYNAQAAQLYQNAFGRAGDQAGIDYWGKQLASGTSPDQVQQAFGNSANTVYNNYAQNPQAFDAQNPGLSNYFKNDAGAQSAVASADNQPASGHNLFNFGNIPNLQNGAPDYMGLAQRQSQYNLNNAQQQSNLNNPNYYGPGGSQVRTQNPDGTYSVTQSLNPQLQQSYDAQNKLQSQLLGNASQLAGNQLNYGNAPGAPTFDKSSVPSLGKFDTSGVSAIPSSDANDLAQTRDSLYSQQTQYLDPQFQQAQSDLENKLANQGITPGSEAYNRDMNNFALQKQKAYGDARNSAIQAGGAEQSRLFGLGLQSNQAGQANALNQFNTGLQANQAGMNNALAGFNTGLQSRQQGVSEANTLHNSPLNDLSLLRGGPSVQLPSYAGQVGTSIPGVDYLNAANQGFNANLGIQNANTAQSTNFNNGLFGLGAAAIQSPGFLNGAWNWLSNLNNNNGGGMQGAIQNSAGVTY